MVRQLIFEPKDFEAIDTLYVAPVLGVPDE